MKRQDFEAALALRIPQFIADIQPDDRATIYDDEPSLLLTVCADADSWAASSVRDAPASTDPYVARVRLPVYRDSAPNDMAALVADALEEADPATWGDESRPIFDDEPPRFVHSAGRHITDTKTGDEFEIQGAFTRDGTSRYDPWRLDQLTRRIVALLNDSERSQ